MPYLGVATGQQGGWELPLRTGEVSEGHSCYVEVTVALEEESFHTAKLCRGFAH